MKRKTLSFTGAVMKYVLNGGQPATLREVQNSAHEQEGESSLA